MNKYKIKVVDQMMGRGKTSAAINMINNSGEEDKFLVITPYREEIDRYINSCPDKKFKTPEKKYNKDNKRSNLLNGIKDLFKKGENIVSTHALFDKFDNEIIEILNGCQYTLIMDEVHNVVKNYYVHVDDEDSYDDEDDDNDESLINQEDVKELLTKYCIIDNKTKQLFWKEEYSDYCRGKFSREKNLCDLGALVLYNKKINNNQNSEQNYLLLWTFPIKCFDAFKDVYILTYMFDAQIQKYYYDYFDVNYKYMYVAGDSLNDYHFTEKETNNTNKIDYKNLIHIYEGKLNDIGSIETSLSRTWYKNHSNDVLISTLKKNLYNFFRNIRNDKTDDNLWTTFKKFKITLNGGGYGYRKCFIPLNTRATNEYKSRTSVAYTINKYMIPIYANFFTTKGLYIDQNRYALSEMLQFIWRSAIRDGKEIWVYIPSIRMRTLLKQWIEENSPKEES